VRKTGQLRVTQFNLRDRWDHLTVNGRQYTNRDGPDGVVVQEGDRIAWKTGNRNVAAGFMICLEDTNAPTASPTDAPTLSPTGAPTLNPLRAFDIARVNNYASGIILSGAGETLDQCITDGPGNYGECISIHLAQQDDARACVTPLIIPPSFVNHLSSVLPFDRFFVY
jgi:hypothetical protein